MICNKCNFQNEDDAKVCGNCGVKMNPPKRKINVAKLVKYILCVLSVLVIYSIWTQYSESNDARNRVNKTGKTGDLTWTLKDGVLIIDGQGKMPNYGRIVAYIKEKDGGGPHLEEGYTEALPWWGSDITTVVINKGVLNIGDNAFCYFMFLKNVVINEGVTTIGKNAFLKCSSLENVILPKSLTTIDTLAFAGCTSLKNITIPDSVVSIKMYAFLGCTNLTNVVKEN